MAHPTRLAISLPRVMGMRVDSTWGRGWQEAAPDDPWFEIPKVGLEPTLPKRETDFESVASANSATSARCEQDWLA